jgi:hypothetical protein
MNEEAIEDVLNRIEDNIRICREIIEEAKGYYASNEVYQHTRQSDGTGDAE